MRASSLLFAVLAGGAGVAVAAAALAQSMAMPTRKPGFWDQTMTMETGRGMTMKSQFCTDASVEKKMSVLGQNMAGSSCRQTSMRKTATGFAFDSTCSMAGRTTTSSGVVSGDFQNGYRIDTVSKSSPPLKGTSGESKMHIEAKWLGPCPAGRKPGDMVMPGGMVMNISTMGAR
ncbi:MAG: DUF3617 family protein [Caulobacteraceae bacterium]